MAVFDSTLTSFPPKAGPPLADNMQDEHAQDNSLNCPGIINANAFSKVKEALVNAFAQPVLAFA